MPVPTAMLALALLAPAGSPGAPEGLVDEPESQDEALVADPSTDEVLDESEEAAPASVDSDEAADEAVDEAEGGSTDDAHEVAGSDEPAVSNPEARPTSQPAARPAPAPAPALPPVVRPAPRRRRPGSASNKWLAEPQPEEGPRGRRPPPLRARKGVTLGAAVGFAACGAGWCEVTKGGIAGRVEGGYRFGALAILVAGDFGRGPAHNVPELSSAGFDTLSGSVSMLDVGGGIGVHPVKSNAVVDPMFAVKLGYNRTKLDASTTGAATSLRETVSRGGFRFSAGLGFYIHPEARLGPRIDLTLPFAGRVCARVADDDAAASSCVTVADAPEIGLKVQQLPLHWSVTLDLQLVLPLPPRQPS